jgi:hypothetical protein
MNLVKSVAALVGPILLAGMTTTLTAALVACAATPNAPPTTPPAGAGSEAGSPQEMSTASPRPPQTALPPPVVVVAPPCEKGDRVMGPNCVHEEREHAEVIDWIHSTVYRMADGKKKIVWGPDLGEIVTSTDKKIVVHSTMLGNGGGPVEGTGAYGWNGTAYAERLDE